MEMMAQAQPAAAPMPAANDAQEVQTTALPIERKRRMFEDSEDAHQKARRFAFEDEDFYHNFDDDQWTDAEKALLAERGQPTYTHNRVKRKVNFLMGMEQRGRTDPKALPRKPRMEMMAEIATDVLVAMDDKLKYDALASEGFFNLAVHGIIAMDWAWDQEEGQATATLVPYEEFFYDKRSKKPDFSDASYIGYAKWLDLDAAKSDYPSEEQNALLQMSLDRERISYAGYDDRPLLWATASGRGMNKIERVRVVVMYYRDRTRQWRLSHFCHAGDLYDDYSPYRDEKGKPRCNLIARSLYIDRENRRYGVVRDMKGPQREDNHLRAKLWHRANDRRMFAVDGAFGDDGDGLAKAKREIAKVDGVLQVNHGMRFGEDWGFVPNADQTAILTQLLGLADQEISRQGPNAGLQGRGASSQSGRSRQVQQEAGMTEENNIFDRFSQWKRDCYETMLLLAKQFWRNEDYIRVTDEEDGVRFVEINQPRQLPDGRTILWNDLGRIDVDIIIEDMPDVANLQAEQFETIANILGMGVPPHYLAALIKTSTLRDKDQLIEMIEAPMQPNPQAAQMAAMEMTERQAKTEKTMAETEKIKAETIHEQASAAVDMTKATLGAV